MKILLFGKDGQVGWELQRSLSPLGDLVALGRDSTGLCGDLLQPAALAETVREVRPDVIVNAAAYTAVDEAEVDFEVANAINAIAPGVLASAAQAAGALMVHYSTDYVFDGTGSRPWLETDAAAPVNAYGRSKLEGDRQVAARCGRHLIFRTGWVYGARGSNFPRTMLRLASERDSLNVVHDQIGAPTGADLLADVTATVVRDTVRHPDKAGLYNLVARGETSWHGYATFALDAARACGWALKAGPASVNPVPSSAFATTARRPLNSRLNSTKLEAAFGLRLPPWQDGVRRLIAEIPRQQT